MTEVAGRLACVTGGLRGIGLAAGVAEAGASVAFAFFDLRDAASVESGLGVKTCSGFRPHDPVHLDGLIRRRALFYASMARVPMDDYLFEDDRSEWVE